MVSPILGNIYKYFPIIILAIFCQKTNGQELKGQVKDADNKAIVSFATVKIIGKDYTKTISADSSGFFTQRNLSFGRYNILVSSIGYETVSLAAILVTAGKQTFLEVELKPSNEVFSEIVVKSDRTSELSSTKSLNIEQSQKYAATWGDPARMALSFAGVTNVNDQSNELVIRGNSPKGLLWMIEGVEVPSPNHFSSEGASGGFIGGLSASVLRNSTFLTGAFPANYGNALSGVFDVGLRTGNSEEMEGSANVSLLGIEAGLEGPISKKHGDSYLVNYRYANTSLINSLGLSNVLNASTPKFEDLTFKFNFRRKKSVISLWGLGGRNTTDFTLTDFLVVNNRANFYASGLKVSREFSKKIVGETTLSISGNSNVSNRNQIWSDQGRNRESNLKNRNTRLITSLYYRLDEHNTLQLGSIVSQLSYDLFGSLSLSFFDLDLSATDTSINSSGSTYSWQNYFLFLLNKNAFSFNIGFHSNYFFLNKQFSLEPRGSMSYKLSNNSRINVGIGIHSRLEPLNTYLFKNDLLLNGKVVDNVNLELSKAAHFVIGFDKVLKNSVRFNSEIYYQRLFNIGVGNSAILPGTNNISLINQINSVNLYLLIPSGLGENYGWEFTIEKSLKDGFYGLFTSSLFKSVYQLNKEAEKLPSRFDNRFVVNSLLGKEWIIKKNLVNINLRSTWAGGIRQLPVELTNGIPLTITDVGYTDKIRNYFRVDLKGSYIFSLGKTTTSASLDINNIFDRANPLTRIFNPVLGDYQVINQLGILPVLSLTFDF